MLVDTFNDFVNAVADHSYKHPELGWRMGQHAFNMLNRVRPDIAFMVAGSDFDPFYSDSNLLAFYDFVARHWEA